MNFAGDHTLEDYIAYGRKHQIFNIYYLSDADQIKVVNVRTGKQEILAVQSLIAEEA